MSVKNKQFLAAVAASLGVTVAANASPVCEGMLNEQALTSLGMAEVSDGTGRVLVVVGITENSVETFRPVADAKGDIRLYANANSAVSLAKRAVLAPGVQVKFVRHVKQGPVGDAIANLKSKYKSAGLEMRSATASKTGVDAQIAAATSLGWNTQVGTPERAQYDGLIESQTSVNEWLTTVTARRTALAASLTAAGIDPLTVI